MLKLLKTAAISTVLLSTNVVASNETQNIHDNLKTFLMPLASVHPHAPDILGGIFEEVHTHCDYGDSDMEYHRLIGANLNVAEVVLSMAMTASASQNMLLTKDILLSDRVNLCKIDYKEVLNEVMESGEFGDYEKEAVIQLMSSTVSI
ncbi:exported hypothetical protein [Vibrio chagasii]|nr:exported hypothetical protein [Vibrio chagasii]